MKYITDKIALEWAERQGLYGIPTMTLRCAISDARSIPELATAEQPPCGQDARDAERWRSLDRFVQYGEIRVPGAGFGRRFKIVEICPTFGDEKDREFGELMAVVDAAIAAQQRQGGEKENV